MRLRSLFCALAVMALVASATPASAAIITFDNLAAWQAAATGVTTITFEENGAGGFTFKGSTATFNGINFAIPSGFLFTIDPARDVIYSTPRHGRRPERAAGCRSNQYLAAERYRPRL